MKHNKLVLFLIGGILVIAASVCFPRIYTLDSNKKVESIQITGQSNAKQKSDRSTHKDILYADPKDLQPEGTWKVKSEKKDHPNLSEVKNLWIRVSLKGNRTYIMSGKKPLYTMLSTGGIYKKGESATPIGTYYIQEERGQEFYKGELNEGARDYVSWRDHGVYLFHSVPTKYGDKIDVKEARKLGKTQGSHGCIRLSLPDAKWLMENVPTGTKVVIKDR